MVTDAEISYEIPKQPEIKPIKEDYGKYVLSDGAIIMVRVILNDVIITGEDPIGPKLALSATTALRVLVDDDVKKRMKDKPLATERIDPRDPGWELVDVIEADPAISQYLINDQYKLEIKLEIVGVAKNAQYRTPACTPVYTVRWGLVTKIERHALEADKLSQ